MSRIEEKKRIVEEVSNKIKSAKVVGIIDLHLLPARLLQKVRSAIRGHGEIIIRKITLLRRALKKCGKEKLAEMMEGEKAIIVSDMNPVELYRKLCSNPIKVYAKPGQIAPEDIVVPAGETNLPPGPVLSELKQAGLDARIQAGKITIAKDCTVVKKGEEISDIVAKALQKLDIKPFEVNVNIPVILEGDLLYPKEILSITEGEFDSMMIDAENSLLSLTTGLWIPIDKNIDLLLSNAERDAIALSIGANIPTEETISTLLSSASLEADSLVKVIK